MADQGLFERGISDEFVNALNALYESPAGAWWKKLADNPSVFVAIRKDAVNAYYRGCSLAEVKFERGEITAATHYKYLLRAAIETPYITARAGKLQYPDALRGDGMFVASLEETENLMAAANRYAGVEKTFVSQIVRNNPNVLDVEIAMTTEGEGDDGPSALRIDLAVLRETDRNLELVMCEAKDFSNRSSLRSSAEAPVIGQIRGYETLLRDYADQLRASYQRVARNLMDLHGVSDARRAWAGRVVDRAAAFTVSPLPVLIICGFDEDQKRGAKWRPHMTALEQGFGANRVIAIGNAESVDLTRHLRA